MLLTIKMLEEKAPEANEIVRVFTERMREEQRSSGGVLLAAMIVLVQQAVSQKVCDPARFHNNSIHLLTEILENTLAAAEAEREGAVIVPQDFSHLRQ